MNTPASVQLIYLWFMNRDLSGFNPRNLPKTDAKEVIKLAHRSSVYAFMQTVATDPELVTFKEGGPNNVPGSFLIKIYHDWIKTQPGHVSKTEVALRDFNREMRSVGFESTPIYHAAVGTVRGFAFKSGRGYIREVLVKAGKWDADQE